jgi:hypothetical protein
MNIIKENAFTSSDNTQIKVEEKHFKNAKKLHEERTVCVV